MAEGNTTLRTEAADLMEEARRELTAETRLLVHDLNPKRAARRLWNDHSMGICIGVGTLAFLVVVRHILRSREKVDVRVYPHPSEGLIARFREPAPKNRCT